MQIKTKIRYHYTLIGMAKIQNTNKPNAHKDVEQQEVSFIAGGNKNGTATLEDSLAVSCKTKHTLGNSRAVQWLGLGALTAES